MVSNFYCDGELSFLNTFDLSYLPQLLTYSFVPSTLLAIFISLFIFIQDKRSFRSFLLVLTALSFSFWSLNDALQWITVPASFNLFFWHLTALFEVAVSLSILAFVWVFSSSKQQLSSIQITILTILLLPVLVFLPTYINISGFNLSLCEGFVQPLITYVHTVSILCLLFVSHQVLTLLKNHSNVSQDIKASYAPKIIASVAAILFLLIFSFANILGETTKEYVIGLVGPIGMNIFLVFLMYSIVKFHTFNVKLIGAQALVGALWVLVGSLLFVAKSDATRTVAGVTLLITTFAGYYLVKSVKREIGQREQIEALAENLEKANERLKILDKMKSEFVSIASHQLRSPLTSIRGYASMLVEGSYGKLPPKALEAVTNIESSSKYMALSVEDYLNVSRIEAGNMKYEMSDFNLKEVAEKIVDEMRSVAMKKGLVMVFRSDCSGSSFVHADIGKTRQVIMNLLDNSMKYTPKGTITVVAHDDVKKMKMYITIQDTGVGMSQETQSEVFDKFVRAKNANNVNVTGTGLGLFVAKKMIVAMKGAVWAESEGEGKGSTFHIELPLVPGTAKR